jgi:hypothetical protein
MISLMLPILRLIMLISGLFGLFKDRPLLLISNLIHYYGLPDRGHAWDSQEGRRLAECGVNSTIRGTVLNKGIT